ncbi:hypothetical protein HD554DRAFT_2168996 [Boletus coccyginus]|nr:hypothetical protein HD554DRAFT_2168996 [Boletus coccyginus]
MKHSLQLDSGDAEQVNNPSSPPSNSQAPPSSAAPARIPQRGDADSVFRDDATVWQDRDMILSPTPPPQPAQPIPAQPPVQGTDTAPTDSGIASLKAIFPDFDDAVILSVLESMNQDHDRALDVLLGMNDPSFVPPNPPPSESPNQQFQSPPSSDAQRLSQEALDEQLARRLAQEEEQVASQPWQSQGVENQTRYQSYQSRQGGRNGWGGQPQGQPQTHGLGGKDTMAEFQEGFNRIAESGRKTFSSIVSKVKAKMQEFDQGQGRSQNQNPLPNQLPQAASGSYYPPNAPSRQQGLGTRRTSQSPPARMGTHPPSPARSGVLRPAATEPAQSVTPQQPWHYDPNARGATPSAAVASESATTHSPATPPPHADSQTTQSPPSDTTSASAYASPVSPAPNSGLRSVTPPARTISPTITGARSTTPGAPGNVDFSKLGLLPKRPISLVRAQSPPATNAGAPRVAATPSKSTTDSSTDREEPEFLENPFEDPR